MERHINQCYANKEQQKQEEQAPIRASRSPSPSPSTTNTNSPFSDAVFQDQHHTQHQQTYPNEDHLHYPLHSRAEVSRIPIDAVANSSAGGASFGEDYPLHRSVMAVPRGGHGGGGLEMVAPSALPFLPASNTIPHSAAVLGSAKYSPTGLPLADLAPLRYSKVDGAGDRNSTGSSTTSGSTSSNHSSKTGGSIGSDSETEMEDLLTSSVKTDTIVSSGSSNNSSAVIWRNIPVIPCYLEPNNHIFLSCADAGEGEKTLLLEAVTGLIKKAFDTCKVDFLFKAEKYKWKAARHKALGSVDFRCRVYRQGEIGGREEGLVVEFQKRQGDYFLMREAFERFLTVAEQAGLVQPDNSINSGNNSNSSSNSNKNNHSHNNNSSKHASSASTDSLHHLGGSGSGAALFQPPPASFGHFDNITQVLLSSSSATMGILPAPPSNPCTLSLPLAPSLAPLLDMASGDCHKTRLEGVRGLAKLSAHEDNRAVLKEADTIPVLVGLVKNARASPEPVLKQAAVIALSNLSESASCQNPLVEAGVVSSLLLLAEEKPEMEALAGGIGRAGFYSSTSAAPPSYFSFLVSASTPMYLEMETRRESARTLANLSEDHASIMMREVGQEGIKQFLRSVDGMGDERLKMHARRFKSRMGQEVC